ncbi:MAG: type I-U CRISPR-associated helicase/endonuclease Cas3 [Candidatus Competibacteraceae bacterium]
MSFERFFRAVHGHDPFPWQGEAARRLVAGEELAAVSVPTACGKTALIDAAIHAAAHGGARRIAFIIDRRVVVDEAFLRAERIAQALRAARNPVLRALAERLGPLQVVRLRGGVHGDDDWLLYPERVTVLVSTVDQIGSRLLHRGYGVSPRMMPLHAGFVGTRALYLIDEAHLSTCFLDTVRAAIDQRADVRVIPMTATPNQTGSALRLDLADYCHPVLSQRLATAKRARLRTAPANEADFAKALAGDAEELATDAKVIGIVVNRVATARRLWQMLATKKRRVVLLTGRVRPHDRDRLMAEWLPRIRAGRTTREDEPLFVAATQTIEVGADLDFDALVSEAAPLDALRQRFGRLDRLGSRAESRAVIRYREAKADESGALLPDPVYGMAVHATWAWLQSVARDDSVDFGVNALQTVMDAHPPPTVEPPLAPVLLPTHVDLLSQTGPDAPEIDVAPWLHGVGRGTADVTLIWRADLEEGDSTQWVETMRLRPPLVGEALEIPVYAVRAWLQGRRAPEVTDIEGVDQESRSADQRGRLALRWKGSEGGEIVRPENIRPGDTLVLPATYGGCDDYGWHPDSRESVADIADFCSLQRGGWAHVVRLVPGLTDWLGERETAVRETVVELVTAEMTVDPETGIDAERVNAARAALRALIAAIDHPLVAAFRGRYEIERHPRGVVLRGRVLDEVDAMLSGGVAVELEPHLAGVATRADRLAADHPEHARIARAAGLHDLGKSESRFQAMLHGDPVAAAAGPVLAKSGLRRLADLRAAYAQSGLPTGFRHELASLALADESDPLVRYLVATHHGYGRPWFPACADDQAPGTEQIPLGSGWADVFVALRRQYGSWVLAGMELVVRAADARQSIAEQEREHD